MEKDIFFLILIRHFIHTQALIQKLVELEKPYILKVFFFFFLENEDRLPFLKCFKILPCERHGLRKTTSVTYVEKAISKHFRDQL